MGSSRKGCTMKVIRTRTGLAIASFGLLASAFGLTVIAASSAAPAAVAVAASAGSQSASPSPNATLIDP
jgi:hypothetical protein